MCVDVTLILGAAALCGQRSAVGGPAPLLTALTVAWLLRVGRGRIALAALIGVFAWGAAARTLAAYELAHARARDALGAPARCEVRGVVTRSPVRRGGALSFDVEVRAATCDHGSIADGARVRLVSTEPWVARGDELDVVADLAPVELSRNPDGNGVPARARRGATLSGRALDARLSARGRTVAAWIDRARAHVRARIDAVYPARSAPLARALVLGEEDLAADEDDAWKLSGLSHLLAVSGSHLAVVVLTFVTLAAAALRRVDALAASTEPGRWAAAAAVPLAFAYADFAGASGSARRAAWMLAVVLVARALGRRSDAPRALGLSLLASAGLDPLAGFDVSLALSALATLGLLNAAPPLAQWLERVAPRAPAALRTATAATVAATAACTPMLSCLGAPLPLAGVAANLVAGPIGELVALPASLAAAALWPLAALERGAATLASGALVATSSVAHAVANIPHGTLSVPPPSAAQLAVLACGAAAWVARRADRRVVALASAAALLLGEAAARRAGAPRGLLRVTFFDVGQGDAALVDLPDGSSMLVDGGGQVGSPFDPGRAVLVPALRARRRARVDVVVLSHPHPDHFLGLASTLPQVEVGELWDTGQGEEEGAGATYATMLADLRRRGARIRRPDAVCGAHRVGGAVIEVLAPCPGITPFANANDNSLVVKLKFGRRSALFVGDAEADEERALLGRASTLRADVLKVGHHGSRTSTSAEFLAAVSPTWAILSTGVRNRFGHPHPSTLRTMSQARVQALRTDRGGAVTWETDGDEQRITR